MVTKRIGRDRFNKIKTHHCIFLLTYKRKRVEDRTFLNKAISTFISNERLPVDILSPRHNLALNTKKHEYIHVEEDYTNTNIVLENKPLLI